MTPLVDSLQKSKQASRDLLKLPASEKNQVLLAIADALESHISQIESANQKDMAAGKANGLTDAMLNRLVLDEPRLRAMANDIRAVVGLPDPIGETLESMTRPNGIRIDKVCVPFGVIAAIYESRPNVTVDIAVLCLKTANACVLKGGSEAIHSNRCLVEVMREAVTPWINPDVITLIDRTDRAVVSELLQQKAWIDLVVPRGGKELIDFVVHNSAIPVIETGAGNCHLYIDETAQIQMALDIALNAKVSRPAVCNAIENILVHEKIASRILPELILQLQQHGVEVRGDSTVSVYPNVNEATPQDFDTEYNDLIVAMKVVKDIDEAIAHINSHSTQHSEAIISEDAIAVARFMNEIDSACVYHNASTRFTDGGEFGFGAELGISTQKLHARGPMGLREMTSYKYQIHGKGEVR